jgi:hypothetical protein
MSEVELRIRRAKREMIEGLQEIAERKGLTLSALCTAELWNVIERYRAGTDMRDKMAVNGTKQGPKRGQVFEEPSEELAEAHYRAKGYHFSLPEWFAYYRARGWVPKGTSRVTKSWEALMVTWEQHWRERGEEQEAGHGARRRKSYAQERIDEAIEGLNELFPVDRGAGGGVGAVVGA